MAVKEQKIPELGEGGFKSPAFQHGKRGSHGAPGSGNKPPYNHTAKARPEGKPLPKGVDFAERDTNERQMKNIKKAKRGLQSQAGGST